MNKRAGGICTKPGVTRGKRAHGAGVTPGASPRTSPVDGVVSRVWKREENFPQE